MQKIEGAEAISPNVLRFRTIKALEEAGNVDEAKLMRFEFQLGLMAEASKVGMQPPSIGGESMPQQPQAQPPGMTGMPQQAGGMPPGGMPPQQQPAFPEGGI